jgi:Predicted oxidoreductases of the aldo/keto reductase family
LIRVAIYGILFLSNYIVKTKGMRTMEKWLGENVQKLGFGLMRLPRLEDGKEIDLPTVNKMVDAFMEAGFTYFDTAFGYLNGQSEGIAKKAVVDRYPREKFLLATKLPPWELNTKEDMPRVFATQLERTGAGYFDFYLIHSVNKSNAEKLDTLDVWSFMKEKKAQGLARHIGFSYHDDAEMLDDILSKHPEMEFVQLQINYADWEDKNIQSRKCYEVARKHGVPVIIMEPVKGGALAVMTDEARAVMQAAKPEASLASWAMRYCGSIDGIVTILSGMSTPEQMEDNIHIMQRFEPLTEGDRETLCQVKKILDATPTVPCTDCKYCVEKCPQDIPIPRVIGTENRRRIYGYADKGNYAFAVNGHGKASDCIQCGVCEARCPQHIEIMDLLKEMVEVFE